MKTALTIAGSDCSGGAGIQADLKTMLSHHVYGMSAITALTAQNTTKVYQIMSVEPDFFQAQLEAIFEDIFPDAIKIGMVFEEAIITKIVEAINKYHPKNIILDPVMLASSGSLLISKAARKRLSESLIPLADMITPNIPEAEILCGFSIENEKQMEQAAIYLNDKYQVNVLLKGGHAVFDANDFYCGKEASAWIKGKRIETTNTHGTGCTLSSAIACNLAKGMPELEAIQQAKSYLSKALEAGLNLGKGSGPMDHGFGSF